MPACRQALNAFLEAETNCLSNANAHHDAGRAANQRMKDARYQIVCLLHILPEEVISPPEPAKGWKYQGEKHSFLEFFDETENEPC